MTTYSSYFLLINSYFTLFRSRFSVIILFKGNEMEIRGEKKMHATEVIEAYIDDTVRFLPRRQRDDVAASCAQALLKQRMPRSVTPSHIRAGTDATCDRPPSA